MCEVLLWHAHGDGVPVHTAGTGITINTVSAHPLPTLAVGVIVPLAAGVTNVRFVMLAVAVYVGISVVT
ncbi:hypothetical protein B0H13DRAFT_2303411 [Mycena leptocephala]|nr:hypothetical protein B0H13DRAFT_2303411 [Mycena leptocephala]